MLKKIVFASLYLSLELTWTSACSVVSDYDWKEEGELAELAPVTIVGIATPVTANLTNDDFYYSPRDRQFTVEVTCVLTTDTDLVTTNSTINVTGFADGASCSSEAPDEPAIIFLDNNADGTFSARYDDPHSAVTDLSEDNLLDIARALDSPASGGLVACGRRYYNGDDFSILFNSTINAATLSTTSTLAVAAASLAALVVTV